LMKNFDMACFVSGLKLAAKMLPQNV